MKKTCGAQGCTKLTERARGKVSRRIDGIEVCRGCYQRMWELEKKTGRTKEEIFREGVEPKRPLPRIKTICARDGCGVDLPENAGPEVRRTISLFHVCRPCYQLAWEHAKAEAISIEEAFSKLKPKNWRPEAPKLSSCCLPWCDKKVISNEPSFIAGGLHVCGRCRTYLKKLTKRAVYNKKWHELVKDAIKGNVPAPGTPELCSMSWCNNREVARRRGPNGEPICNTDATYLRYYAKRHGLSFGKAFMIAPAPRLLHTRHRRKV